MNTNQNITAGENFTLHLGDNLATLKNYPADTFDSIVTDPPYGIDFLGKEWDSHTGTVELYKECLRVLKPGGYLLAFSAARTYHKLAYSVELAGFEIRDQLMWLYSSGFPKAQDIGKAIDKRAGKVEDTIRNSTNGMHGERIEGFDLGSGTRCPTCKKDGNTRYSCDKGNDCGMVYKPATAEGAEWNGWKTALKPAHEPIVVARKPYKGSTIDNVLKNGLGAMNIDATRVPWAENDEMNEWQRKYDIALAKGDLNFKNNFANFNAELQGPQKKKKTKIVPDPYQRLAGPAGIKLPGIEIEDNSLDGRYPSNVIGEVAEGYQKYFYCPKVSRKERHIGFDIGDDRICSEDAQTRGTQADHASKPQIGNNHPTVKPVALMEYLIKLVTPLSTETLQRKVLDPFNGSGSTGIAVVKLGHHYTGCELDPKYIAIAKTRIEAWNKPNEDEDDIDPDNPDNDLPINSLFE